MNVKAHASRGTGNWWVIECETPSGPVYTQARRLDGIEPVVRDACQLMGVPVDRVDIIAENMPAILTEYREAARQSREMADKTARLLRDTITELRGAGLSVRDVGTLVGLSPQRVAQLSHD